MVIKPICEASSLDARRSRDGKGHHPLICTAAWHDATRLTNTDEAGDGVRGPTTHLSSLPGAPSDVCSSVVSSSWCTGAAPAGRASWPLVTMIASSVEAVAARATACRQGVAGQADVIR
jgi:hypothetical protein